MGSRCRDFYEGDPLMEAYHDHEWCRPNHDDRFQFEMLCLEGASVGLSWATIVHKREDYRRVFHDFDICACATMTDEEVEAALNDAGIIRNRNKVASVRKNARVVQAIQQEFGSFDAYLWGFTGGLVIDNRCESPEEMPTTSEVSIAMSKDMKRRGMSFVGPIITYSFLQSIGIVNDHLLDCPCRNA